MADFVKVGDLRINLDQIEEVEEFDAEMVIARYRSGKTRRLRGTDATLMLALVDEDDETVDALYERVNRKVTQAN